MGNIATYLFMVITTFLYTYIIGGDASMITLYMLILAPLLSITITYLIRKEIVVCVDVPNVEVEKGGNIKVSITAQNKTYIPIPFLDITLLKPENLSFINLKDLKFSLGPRETKTIDIEYLAKQRGVSRIGIKNVLIRDYLGFYRFAIMENAQEKEKSGEVVVLPRIVNIKQSSKILMSSGQTNTLSDEGDATTSIISWTGEPGYEFREYMPGDPLHKIHWKLSAKRELLMVRKDEGRGIAKKRLILDPFIKLNEMYKKDVNSDNSFTRLFSKVQNSKLNEYDLEIEEKILEALLAVVNLMVKSNRETEVWIYDRQGWVMLKIADSKSVNMLQHKLAEIKFIRNNWDDVIECMPVTGILEQGAKSRAFYGGEAIVFTGVLDDGLKEHLAGLANNKISIDLVLVRSTSDSDGINNISGQDNLWVVNLNDDISEAFI